MVGVINSVFRRVCSPLLGDGSFGGDLGPDDSAV